MQVLAIDLDVQTSDGAAHTGVRLAVDGTRRVYLLPDGTELIGIEQITKCTVIVPPIVLAAALHKCMECEQ